MSMHQFWNRIVASRYTRSLEAEVGRLRAENRALLNSILGIAGIPPIVVTLEESAEDVLAHSRSAGGKEIAGQIVGGNTSFRSRPRSDKSPTRGVAASLPPPVRHRSWQQVNRMLEFDSVRKRERDTSERPPQASSHT
jgi:hypothetical protein